MKPFKLLFFFLSLSSTTLVAQKDMFDNVELETIATKISYYGRGNIKTLEVGLMPMWSFSPGPTPMGAFGPFISAGLATSKKNVYVMPRVGFDFHIGFLGSRVSFVNYTNFKQSDYYILPEVGISFIGLFSVLYGYNINLSRVNNFGLETHKISITIAIPTFDWFF